ncbi:hypothetical protein [Aquimarina algiphila]|uniref:Uncharacterized protein n=1 Tax=Aquimarina algiphila TaxID=2047982 RepID=A0A554VEF1_9FLAO|nr:hypothetical protein [Aquimarina algiphila]TSE05392.1 hypothetical protein FOF46_22780 [Aquimarina algiphila]
MNRKEAKKINQEIRESGIISNEIYEFLEKEIDLLLEEELREEKSRVRHKISALFNDNYFQASDFFKQSLQISY